MEFPDIALAALVAVIAGLDRTAMLQAMISRPLVVAPLVGMLLGCPAGGVQIGLMCELLWLGRLPVGAAIPPDDTQVAVGATTLFALQSGLTGESTLPLAVLCLLVAIPLGKAGQMFDRLARERNGRMQQRWDDCLKRGEVHLLERLHLQGLLHFGLASLATFLLIVLVGGVLVKMLVPPLLPHLVPVAAWVRLSMVAVGVAAIIGSLNVGRTMTLFSASFVTGLTVLWLV